MPKTIVRKSKPSGASHGRTKLTLVSPASSPEDQIRKSLDTFLECELENFAESLNEARWIWKHAPELLTAESFPEPFRGAYCGRHGCPPDETIGMVVDVTQPDLRERLYPHAVAACTPFFNYKLLEDQKFHERLRLAYRRAHKLNGRGAA